MSFSAVCNCSTPPAQRIQDNLGPKTEENVSWPVSRVLSGVASATAIHLGRPSLDASSNQPGWRAWKRACRLDFSTCRPSLFGLAPDGVCRAGAVTGTAVRSYRTVSPLPSGLSRRAVCSLWHFPWGRPRRSLTAILFPWSPDFPPPARCTWAITPRPAAAVQPTDT